MTALVTCGDTRAGLAAVRSLGRSGVAVAVGAPHRPALALWSRYATSTLLLPDARTDAKRFADAVASEAHGRSCSMALAATDDALWALSRWRDQLPASCHRVLPPHDGLARALDRSALHDRVRSLGLLPLEVVRIDVADEIEPALRRVPDELPVIVRPRVPWIEREDGTRRVAESIPVEEKAELRRLLYAREDLVAGGLVLEPRPRGRWLGYGAVCDEGRVLVEVFQERRRERGDLSGVSTLACTIEPDDEVRAAARALLDSLSWQGPVLVEMLREDDGTPRGTLRIANVIGRLWGSVQLAINAGVDVPVVCERLVRGQTSAIVAVAEPGHVWRWVVGDLEVMAKRTRRLWSRFDGKRALRQRLASFTELFAVDELLGARPDVFDLDDPLPFILEVEHRVEEARRTRRR